MLTDAKIGKLPHVEDLIPCGDRLGLYLRTRATGRRTFVLRRRVAGQWTVETFKPDWPRLSLLNARRRAGATKPKIGTADTFSDAADRFCRDHIDKHYRSSAKEA